MTASKFRMYVDKNKAHKQASEDEVVVGAVFTHKTIDYTVLEVTPDTVKMEGRNGMALRSTIVEISELTKSGSDYLLNR